MIRLLTHTPLTLPDGWAWNSVGVEVVIAVKTNISLYSCLVNGKTHMLAVYPDSVPVMKPGILTFGDGDPLPPLVTVT